LGSKVLGDGSYAVGELAVGEREPIVVDARCVGGTGGAIFGKAGEVGNGSGS
jgi:hypothetical protein